MGPDALITNVRLMHAPDTVTEIQTVDGVITAIGDAAEDRSATMIDAEGWLALPGFVDGHAHLDKTMWGLPWRPHSAEPGLAGLIANERRGRRELPPVRERAADLLAAYLAQGTTLIRTHVDVDVDQGVSAVEGVLAAAVDSPVEVEVVAFPQSGMLIAPGTAELLDAAVASGASLVGGIDPAGLDNDPVNHLDSIFSIADKHGVGIDIHLHDRGSLGRWEIELIIERTRALTLAGRVTISHAFALCDGDPAVDPLLEELAAAGIALATVAPASIDPLPLRRIVELEIPICLGQDGIRDLWSPWGDADMLARAGQLAWRAGARHDRDIECCVEVATWRGGQALGRDNRALRVGDRADIVLVDAAGAAEAAVTAPSSRRVIVGGAMV